MDLALAPRIKSLGLVEYSAVLARMREFTLARDADTPDELWVVEHPPVYTLGQGADPKFGPKDANGIPVVQAERGGEITYHGPGQAVIYTMIDIARRGIKVKTFVQMLEQCVINFLTSYEIQAERKAGAPGVYVGGAKIAALGLRVRQGCTYHGLALNVDCDLEPFAHIDPCGYPDLAATRLRDLGVTEALPDVAHRLTARLAGALGYTAPR